MADDTQQQTVPLVSTTGPIEEVNQSDVPDMLQNGYTHPTDDQLHQYQTEQLNSSPLEQTKAAAEGAAQTLSLGASTGIETGLGIANNEDINRRRGLVGHTVGAIGGLGIMSAVPGLNVLGAAGEGAAAAVGGGALTSAVVNQGTQMALLQAGDEVSKHLSDDPTSTVGNAIAHIGLASVIGGAFGLGGAAISKLSGKVAGSSLGQMAADFKGKALDMINNPDPVSNVTDELNQYYKSTTDPQVYGDGGLKAQDIAKAMPPANPAMAEQAKGIYQSVGTSLDQMEANPNLYPSRLVSSLDKDWQVFGDAVQNSQQPADIYNAIQRMKQVAQDWGSQFVKPIDDSYGFVKQMQELGPQLRGALEDSSVWGEAANRQKAINGAFTKYLPALKDFESKFTSGVAGERQVDPGKIASYINSIGKPSAELKQSMMQSFIDASEKYRGVINDIHDNLGVESPLVPQSLSATRATLGELTPGARLAQTLVGKGLSKMAGSSIGGALGAAAGAPLGQGAIGAIVGQHALGPLIDSVMPSLVGPMLGKAASSEGMSAAAGLGMAAINGAKAVAKGADSLFKAGGSAYIDSLVPSKEDTEKLDEQFQYFKDNPMSAVNSGGKTGHYLPNHAAVIGSKVSQVGAYLDSERPKSVKQNILDTEMKPTATQKANYTRTLQIAEQPLSILSRIKDGSLIPQDVQDMEAMHPEIRAQLGQEMTRAIIEHMGAGNSVPYHIRQGASLLAGQPLDSTMTPQAIQSVQAVFAAQQQASQAAPVKNKKGTSSLSKASNQYQTPGQARESSRQTQD